MNIPSFRVCHARATFLSLCFVSNSGAVRVKIVPSHIWRPISLSFHIYPFILDVRDPGLFSSLDKKPVCICLDQSPEAPTSVILQPCLSCPHRRRRIFMPAVKAPSVAFGPWSLVNRDTLTTVLNVASPPCRSQIFRSIRHDEPLQSRTFRSDTHALFRPPVLWPRISGI